MTPTDWQRIGDPAPTELSAARGQLHNAVQIVQSLGRSLLLERDDDSQAALSWLPEPGVLAGQPADGRRLALRPDDLVLLDLDAETLAIDSTFALPGRSVNAAVDWLRSRLGRNAAAHSMEVPYDIGEVAFADEELFTLDPGPACAELGRWFGNAQLVLSSIAERDQRAGPVRCWPHHFDIATLIVVAEGAPKDNIEEPSETLPWGTLRFDEDDQTRNGNGNGQDSEAEAVDDDLRTLGVGLSPGDEAHHEPYFYVTPWPPPDEDEPLPELPAPAVWHTKGFTAAILTASALLASGGPETHEATLRRTLDAALQACEQLHAVSR